MNKQLIAWSGIGIVALSLAAFGVWMLSLPPRPAAAAVPPLPDHEVEATLAALKPPQRQRPLIAVIGINEATETTDYLVPYGILRRANIADVVALATRAGPVQLFPALKVEPQATVAAFDAEHPQGADYVIVPAMSRDNDPEALAWLKSQASKGATIIGVCAGAKVVAAAGLLDGKRATTHWYYLKQLRSEHPTIQYVPNRRLVADERVATTTGITASIPMMLTLIEAIAGRDKAESVGQELGLTDWNALHDSDRFKFTRPFASTVLGTVLAFWKREQLGFELVRGMDEVSMALVADAWSRTYRSRAVTFASSASPRETRNGLQVIPDQIAASGSVQRIIPTFADKRPTETLDQTLGAIAAGTACVRLTSWPCSSSIRAR